MKIVIVGGVAGGATAAARIRRLDEKAEIVIFERTGFISYANCGLPYFIGDVINDPDDLTLQSPAGFFRRFRINAKIHHLDQRTGRYLHRSSHRSSERRTGCRDSGLRIYLAYAHEIIALSGEYPQSAFSTQLCTG